MVARSASSSLVVFALVAAALKAVAHTVPVARDKDTVTPTPVWKADVGIYAAYLPEYLSQVSQLTGTLKNYTFGGRLFTTGHIGDKRVVSTMSGIGLVNAAITAQMMIFLFAPKFILLSGIAGGIDPAVQIGDVVIPKMWSNPQLQKLIRPLYEPATGAETNMFLDVSKDFPDKFYSEPGLSAGAFSFDLPTRTSCNLSAPTTQTLNTLSAGAANTVSPFYTIPMETELLINTNDTFLEPTPPTRFWLPVSQIILNTAAKVLPTLTLANSAGAGSLPYTPTAKIVNRGMSANAFVDNADYRKRAFDLFGFSCVEMEGQAFMQVCLSNHVECAVVRSISDLAGGAVGQEGESEIGVFFAVAALNTATVSVAIIKALPKELC
mmetsp:Transcript_13289/g.23381  ORF Transcript_13289/g.23381 Transcript_13289/m.23381 type:complete len:380 (+) Transcript_13289:77-1216(+)